MWAKQEAQEGLYRSTASRQKLNLQTAPPPGGHVFLTNHHGLKESRRVSPNKHFCKIIENRPNSLGEEDF